LLIARRRWWSLHYCCDASTEGTPARTAGTCPRQVSRPWRPRVDRIHTVQATATGIVGPQGALGINITK